MTSSQHVHPTKAEFLCVFPVLYRREKNVKKISVTEKKGLVTLVKTTLQILLYMYVCMGVCMRAFVLVTLLYEDISLIWSQRIPSNSRPTAPLAEGLEGSQE